MNATERDPGSRRPSTVVSAAVLVFLGGGLGSLARYGIARCFGQHATGTIPWHTFAVNLVGSLLLGALVGYAATREVSESARAFLAVGLLGGFTTYSTFNMETLALFEQRGATTAAGYVLGTVLLCLVAGWSGGFIAHRFVT